MSDPPSAYPPSPPPPPPTRWARSAGLWTRHRLGNTFRSLRHPNYRLFFIGQGISLVGTWVQNVARGWLVYEMTRNPAMLGLVAFCSLVFQLPVPPLAGVLADRFNRRTMILVTQGLATVLALLLAALALTGWIQVWHIVALSLFGGLVASFDVSVRQSFVADMIADKEDFGNAIALNSSLFNIARIIGPAIGGALIAGSQYLAKAGGMAQHTPYAGAGICFLINALSFMAVIVALLRMDMPRRRVQSMPPGRVLSNMREGFAYTFSHAGIRSILLLLAAISLIAMPFTELLPVFAKRLSPDPRVYGYLLSAHGLGAFAGAIMLASRRRTEGLWTLMVVAVGLLGAGLVLFSHSHWLGVNLALLTAVGFAMMIRGASANTLIQTLVEDDKRGRVISIYIMAQMGIAPFGHLLQGYLAKRFGAPAVVLVAGALCLVAAGWFAVRLTRLRRQLRSHRFLEEIPAPSDQTAPAHSPSKYP